MSPEQLSIYFFLQMAVILGVCRLVGALARRCGQPQVVGEMIAGVMLGPSLFGYFCPSIQAALFPKETLRTLYVGAQLGVGIYMFIVGTEFRVDHFRTRARSAASVSFAGMAAPFAFAVVLAPWLRSMHGLFSEKVRPFEAILFLGASIAITAFPMLARIIYERGLTGTALGTLALAAGAIDDAAAWCVLAVVLATFGGGALVAVKAIAGGATYALFMIFAGSRLLAPLGRIVEREKQISPTVLGIVLMLFCLGAFAMDAIGIHAVFGGFLLGIAMPRGAFVMGLKRKIEPFAVVFLLPMFFTFSGLRTRLDLVKDPKMLLVALVILVASIGGKGIACWAAARLNGEDNRTSLAVGTLMNSRGLMELIIINIGLQKGVIEPVLFSMLVLMAIVTTLIASPLFELVYGRQARISGELGAVPIGG